MAVQVGQGRSRSSPASPGAEKGENLGEGSAVGLVPAFLALLRVLECWSQVVLSNTFPFTVTGNNSRKNMDENLA